MATANDREHDVIWRSIDRIEKRFDELSDTVKRGTRGAQISSLAPWLVWAVVALVSTCNGKQVPQMPGVTPAHAAPSASR